VGLFKSLRDIKKQSDEVSANWDVGAQLEQAQAQMQAGTQFLADQTAAAKVATSGVDATATIVAVRQGHGMVNFQPMVEIDLTIVPEGLPPYPVTVKQAVPQVQLAQVRPGASVHVKVDPDDPSTVWIDWARPA
jgi:hypothetical protein